VLVVVIATEAGAVLSAGLARREALAVHLEAFRFFAGAARFLLLDQRGGCDGLVLGGLQFAIEGNRGLL